MAVLCFLPNFLPNYEGVRWSGETLGRRESDGEWPRRGANQRTWFFPPLLVATVSPPRAMLIFCDAMDAMIDGEASLMVRFASRVEDTEQASELGGGCT